jgi:hypothetical protein
VKRDRRVCLSSTGRVEEESKKEKENKLVNNKGQGRGETT